MTVDQLVDHLLLFLVTGKELQHIIQNFLIRLTGKKEMVGSTRNGLRANVGIAVRGEAGFRGTQQVQHIRMQILLSMVQPDPPVDLTGIGNLGLAGQSRFLKCLHNYRHGG